MQGSPIFLDARDGVAISHAEMPLDSPCQNSLATASGTIFVLLGLTLPARRSTTLMYGISPILISEEGLPCPPRTEIIPSSIKSPREHILNSGRLLLIFSSKTDSDLFPENVGTAM